MESAALVKFGYMLEYPCIPRYSFGNQTSDSVCEPNSEKPSDADNQQERLIKVGWITGLLEIVEIVQTMNHCKPRTEMIRILRDYMPDTEFNPVKI